MLAMVSSWLTPTSLFVTINFVIATIVITSRFGNRNSFESQQLGSQTSPQLIRAPSLLNRVKSFNFTFHSEDSFDVHANSEDLHSAPSAQLVRAPSFLNRIMSGKFAALDGSEKKTTLEVSGDNVNSGGGDFPVKGSEKTKKSASEKFGKRVVEESEEIEMRRSSSVRVDDRESGGEEIDAKAEDFINKFKQQLKLQRLDSLLRYRNMLKGK